jgi:hypothetical protein
MFLLSHVTPAQRVILLPATATLFRDPQYPRPFLRLLAALRGQILVPTPLSQSVDRFHYGIYLRDIMHRYIFHVH